MITLTFWLTVGGIVLASNGMIVDDIQVIYFADVRQPEPDPFDIPIVLLDLGGVEYKKDANYYKIGNEPQKPIDPIEQIEGNVQEIEVKLDKATKELNDVAMSFSMLKTKLQYLRQFLPAPSELNPLIAAETEIPTEPTSTPVIPPMSSQTTEAPEVRQKSVFDILFNTLETSTESSKRNGEELATTESPPQTSDLGPVIIVAKDTDSNFVSFQEHSPATSQQSLILPLGNSTESVQPDDTSGSPEDEGSSQNQESQGGASGWLDWIWNLFG